MAVTDGTAILKFGTTTVTGYIVQSVTETESSEEVEIADEAGDYVTHVNDFGKKVTATFECVVKSGTTLPVIGATWSYTSATGGAVKYTVTGVDASENNRDVTKCTVTGVRYPDITIT